MLDQSFGKKSSMVSKISLKCTNPVFKYECCLSHPDSDEAKKLNRSALLFGLGRGSPDTFTAGLELLLPLTKIPPLTKEPFNRENKSIAEKVGK